MPWTDVGRLTLPDVGAVAVDPRKLRKIGALAVGVPWLHEASQSPLGAPVPIIEGSGEKVTRPPTSQDVAATVIRAFGLQPDKDFLIPGGYGEFEGAILPG